MVWGLSYFLGLGLFGRKMGGWGMKSSAEHGKFEVPITHSK